jgi:hypothetical protein
MIELKNFNVHKIADSKEKAQKLISLGFSVFKDEENIMGISKEENIVETDKEVVDYNSMTMEQLKVLCKENSLEGYTNLVKEDLIAFMQENIKG